MTPETAVPELSQTRPHHTPSQPVPHTPGTPPDLHKHHTRGTVPSNTPGTALSNTVSAGQRMSHPVPPSGEVGLRHHTRLHLPDQGALDDHHASTSRPHGCDR